MFAEVSREVLLGHASIVTRPPGVQDQDVPRPYLHLALDQLGCIDAPLAHLADVDNGGRPTHWSRETDAMSRPPETPCISESRWVLRCSGVSIIWLTIPLV